MMVELKSYGDTHVGLVRHRNEDSYGCDPSAGAYVVADGMGGHPDGDTASRLAVSSVLEVARLGRAATKPGGDQLKLLARAIAAAHSAVSEANGGRSSSESMGSTISVLLTSGADFVVGNVGDSKAFSVASVYGVLKVAELTTDHTVASELVRRGAPPNLIIGGQGRSLTQAIGIGSSVRPRIVEGRFALDDSVVICSDGITDYVTPEAFRDVVVRTSRSPELLVRAVIEAALKGGGGDNCTCLCVKRVR